MPKTLATATVDRLLHHAHVVMTAGDSFCLAAAPSGKGMVPLRRSRGQNRWPYAGKIKAISGQFS